MTGSVTLIVTTEELNAQSEVVLRRVNAMRTRFQNMRDIALGRTSGYWIGAAGDAYRKRYQSFQADIDEMLKRLEEYVTDLRQMAGIYQAAENSAVQAAEELPADVIQ